MSEVINGEAEETLLDLHRGIHAVIEALDRRDDPDKALEIARQVDVAMTNFINRARVAR